MQYRSIVFVQGDEAKHPLDLLGDDHDKALDYLLQWDYGDGEIYNVPPWGKSDTILYQCQEKYVISYNRHLDYISLTEIIR